MYAPCCAVSMTLASQATDLRHSGPEVREEEPRGRSHHLQPRSAKSFPNLPGALVYVPVVIVQIHKYIHAYTGTHTKGA